MTEKIRAYLRGEKGFTLVEMMVVLIIIAVLIAGGIRFYLGYIGRSKATKATGDINTMQAALDSYYAQNTKYPDGNSMEAAGLSTGMIASTISTGIPYTYTHTSDTHYVIQTAATVDGTHYVTGSGDSGRSDSPYTSP